MKNIFFIASILFLCFSSIIYAKDLTKDFFGFTFPFQIAGTPVGNGGEDADAALLESGDYLLLENGDKLLLE